MPSIVIPAHNEADVIERLLTSLTEITRSGEAEVVVVANGCADDTAPRASAFPGVKVVTTPLPNKHRALRLGDEHASTFPRLYVDADVVLTSADARRIFAALEGEGVLAAAPGRGLDRTGSSWTVRAYYDVWEELPTVQEGLYGRGVIGVSAAGYARLAALPEVMGDDLAASLTFAESEREIVDGATATIRIPRTTGDLLRRRVRSATVVAQVGEVDAGRLQSARTSVPDVVRVALRRPGRAPKVAVFLGVTLLARWRARARIRSRDYTTWLRDESSRRDEARPR